MFLSSQNILRIMLFYDELFPKIKIHLKKERLKHIVELFPAENFRTGK